MDWGDTVDTVTVDPSYPGDGAPTRVSRRDAMAVRRYLERLERAEVLDPERAAMAHRLASLRRLISDTRDEAERASLIDERESVEEAMWAARDRVVARDRSLEADFVAVALGYSRRKGISPEAWQLVGVPDGVLQRAGLLEETTAEE